MTTTTPTPPTTRPPTSTSTTTTTTVSTTATPTVTLRPTTTMTTTLPATTRGSPVSRALAASVCATAHPTMAALRSPGQSAPSTGEDATGMPQVPVPVLHRGGLFGPPPTQLDVVVDLAWCDVCTVAVSDPEFDRLAADSTARHLFLPATDNVSVRCWVTGSGRGRFFDRCPRHCFGRCAERYSGCGCVVRHGCRTGERLLTSMVG